MEKGRKNSKKKQNPGDHISQSEKRIREYRQGIQEENTGREYKKKRRSEKITKI